MEGSSEPDPPASGGSQARAPLRVLLLAAVEDDARMAQLADAVTGEARGRLAVDRLDAFVSSPAVEQLLGYDVVLLMGTHPLADPGRLGDALDEYVGCGGGVVLAPFVLSDDQAGGTLKGRLADSPDMPTTCGPDDFAPGADLRLLPDAGVTRGVAQLARPEGAVPTSLHRHQLQLRSRAEALASWQDGVPLVAELEPGARPARRGRVVVLNLGLHGQSRELSQARCRPVSRLLSNLLHYARARRSSVALAACNGFVLDGFPSSREEADLLDAAGVRPDVVLVVEGESEQEIVARHAAMWVDPVTRRRYDMNVHSPSPEVRARLVQHARDKPAAVKLKFDKQRARIEQLQQLYQSIVVHVDVRKASCEAAVGELGLVFEAAGRMPLVLVLGLPGCGKGKLAHWLSDQFGMEYLSMPIMLHQAVAEGLAPALKASTLVAAKKPVPAALRCLVLATHLGISEPEEWTQLASRPRPRVTVKPAGAGGWVGGWLLDCVIRSAEQADLLRANGIEPDLVISPLGLSHQTEFRMLRERERQGIAEQLRITMEMRRVFGSKVVTVSGAERPGDALKAAGVLHALRRRDVRVAVFGAPRSGKGTLCEHLVQTYGLKYISMSVLVAAAKAEMDNEVQTRLSIATAVEAVEQAAEAKELVPASVLFKLLSLYLLVLAQEQGETTGQPTETARKWLLDGHPQSKSDVQALMAGKARADLVLVLEGEPEAEVLARASQVWMDPVAKKQIDLRVETPSTEVRARLVQHRTPSFIKKQLKIFTHMVATLTSSGIGPVVQLPRIQSNSMEGLLDSKVEAILKKESCKVIVVGQPRSGKGKLCLMLCQLYGLSYFNTATLAQSATKLATSLGSIVQETLALRQRLSESTMLSVIDQLLPGLLTNSPSSWGAFTPPWLVSATGGAGTNSAVADDGSSCDKWLLDGFPSSREEADLLDAAGVRPDVVLVVEGESEQEIVDRHAAMWVDPVTRRRYDMNVHSPSPEVRARLVQHARDKPAAVAERCRKYRYEVGSIRDLHGEAVRSADGKLPPKDALGPLVEMLSGDYVGVFVIGLPMSGKGRLCEFMCSHFGLEYFSPATVLQEAISSGSQLGRKAQMYREQTKKAIPSKMMAQLLTVRLGGSLQQLTALSTGASGSTFEEHERNVQRVQAGIRGWHTRQMAWQMQAQAVPALPLVPSRMRKNSISQDTRWVFSGFPETEEEANSLDSVGARPHLVLVLDESLTLHIRNVCIMCLIHQVDDPTRYEESLNEKGHLLSAPGARVAVLGGSTTARAGLCEWLTTKYSMACLVRDSRKNPQLVAEIVQDILGVSIGAGQTQPDKHSEVVQLVTEHLFEAEEKGWLLDGCPASKQEADLLSELHVRPDLVLVVEPDPAELEKEYYWMLDPSSNTSYLSCQLAHKERSQLPMEVCNRLVPRQTERASCVASRLARHAAEVESLVSFYGQHGVHKVRSTEEAQAAVVGAGGAWCVLVLGPASKVKRTICEELAAVLQLRVLNRASMHRCVRCAQREAYMNPRTRDVTSGLLVRSLAKLVGQPPPSEEHPVRGQWMLDNLPANVTQAQMLAKRGVVPALILVRTVPDEEHLVDTCVQAKLGEHAGEHDGAMQAIQQQLIEHQMAEEIRAQLTEHSNKANTLRACYGEAAVLELPVTNRQATQMFQRPPVFPSEEILQQLATVRPLLEQEDTVVLVLGAPRTGKGEICRILTKQFKFTNVSEPMLLWDARSVESTDDAEAREALTRSSKLPDELVVRMVCNKIRGVQPPNGPGDAANSSQAVLDNVIKEVRTGLLARTQQQADQPELSLSKAILVDPEARAEAEAAIFGMRKDILASVHRRAETESMREEIQQNMMQRAGQQSLLSDVRNEILTRSLNRAEQMEQADTMREQIIINMAQECMICIPILQLIPTCFSGWCLGWQERN